MRRISYKFILMALLPLLLVAFSPMRVMVCTQKMEKCPPCCHEMMVKKSAAEVQLSSINDCCIIHASEGFTAIAPLQKIEDISKKKFCSLSAITSYLDSYTLQHAAKSDAFYPFAAPPHPPLILIKSSFLI